MNASDPAMTPSGHTPEGESSCNAGASRAMVLFEDPQCPYCRQFEELNGPLIAAAVGAGELAVEYRMRCFLGPESVRGQRSGSPRRGRSLRRTPQRALCDTAT